MSAPSSANYATQLISTTREMFDTTELINQTLKQRPALELFQSVAKSGTGRKVLVNIAGGEDDSTEWTDDAGTFNTDRSDEFVGTLEFPWSKPLVGKARVNWLESEMNKGNATQLQDFAKTTWDKMVEGHAKKLDAQLHAASAGTTRVSTLLELIDDTIAVGGLDPAFTPDGGTTLPNAFWKSTVVKVDPANVGIRKAFRTTINQLYIASGGSRPDTVLAGLNVYEAYEDSLDDAARVALGSTASAVDGGFTEIKHDGLTIRLDPELDVDTALFITKNDLVAKYLNDNFMSKGEPQVIVGTHETVTPFTTVIGFGVKERRKHAKLVYKTIV